MDTRLVVVVAIILFLDVLAIGLYVSAVNATSSESHPFTVSEVYDKALLGDYVYVKGRLKEVLEDHVSEKGFVYQQSIITDGGEDIKFFCSVKYGRAEIEEGDEIIFDGEFKKYYGTHEIDGFCSEVKIL